MEDLFSQISELIQSARKVTVHNVNTLQVLMNYEIGRRIVQYEQKGAKRAEYGVLRSRYTSERVCNLQSRRQDLYQINWHTREKA